MRRYLSRRSVLIAYILLLRCNITYRQGHWQLLKETSAFDPHCVENPNRMSDMSTQSPYGTCPTTYRTGKINDGEDQTA